MSLSINSAADTAAPGASVAPRTASPVSPLTNGATSRVPLETEVQVLKTQVTLLESRLAEMEKSMRFFSNNIPRIHNAE